LRLIIYGLKIDESVLFALQDIPTSTSSNDPGSKWETVSSTCKTLKKKVGTLKGL